MTLSFFFCYAALGRKNWGKERCSILFKSPRPAKDRNIICIRDFIFLASLKNSVFYINNLLPSWLNNQHNMSQSWISTKIIMWPIKTSRCGLNNLIIFVHLLLLTILYYLQLYITTIIILLRHILCSYFIVTCVRYAQ